MRYNFLIKRKELYIYIFTFLLIFQSAMERVSSFFSYVDEVIALIGFAFVVVYVGNTKKNFKKRKNQIVIFFVFLFLLAGLVGNFIYKYQ
ncbi:MAG: hypothetical protein LUG83_03235, partial [Lachnospiraceae bacterium]|nr:hypothetical protein [Lachnospiraceae bacterium]